MSENRPEKEPTSPVGGPALPEAPSGQRFLSEPAPVEVPDVPTVTGSRLTPTVAGEEYPEPPYGAALLITDPPKIGDFWLDARLTARASGVTYLAHEDHGEPAMLIILSEGAAGDAAARDRLAGEVNKMSADTVLARGGHGQDTGRLGFKYRSDDEDPIGPNEAPLAPWVALAYDGSMNAVVESDRILRSIDLSSTPAIGAETGPDYELPWIDKSRPGAWRVWPLPWPGRKDRAGWMSILVSLLLMLLLTALALLIIVLIFQNAPNESPQPPVPTNQSGEGSPPPSGDPSEQSGDPSEQSGEPSEQSGEPTDSADASPSEDSAEPSGDPTESGGFDSPSKDPSMQTTGPSGTGGGSAENTRL